MCSPACLHLPGWEGEAAGALPLLELDLVGGGVCLPWGVFPGDWRSQLAGRQEGARCAQRVLLEEPEDGKAAPSSWLTRRQSIFKLISLT